MKFANNVLFASQELAARIDRAEGRMCAETARKVAAESELNRSEVFEIAGGVAAYAGHGSPSNKMIGAGFEGLPDEHELERVEQAFRERGTPLQAEVSTLADPAFHALLVRRGYEPRGFENVLGHPLESLDTQPLAGISVEPAEVDDHEDWVDTIVTAFETPDVGGVGGDTSPSSDELRRWALRTLSAPGFEAAIVRLNGQIAGCGSIRVDAGIAQFCGAGTLPAFRRRGIQTALLRWRLQRAHAANCDVAIVTTQPASKSQQNVQRQGFHLLYARQLLVKTA